MAKDFIAIIDYGSGNIRSAAKAFEHVIAEQGYSLEVKVSSCAQEIQKASKIILPGQGAFGDCMQGLLERDGLQDVLEEKVIKLGTPFLGICVGMQLLATEGLEYGSHQGLGWIPGRVIPIEPKDPSLKIPHMGWNNLEIPCSIDQQDQQAQEEHSQSLPQFVLRSTDSEANYYFVHSFMFECNNEDHVLATTDYGEKIVAIVGRDNIIGTQFHPEKSQKHGLQLINNFINWKP